MSQMTTTVTIPGAEYGEPGLTLATTYDLVRKWIVVKVGNEAVQVEAYDLLHAVKACMEIHP